MSGKKNSVGSQDHEKMSQFVSASNDNTNFRLIMPLQFHFSNICNPNNESSLEQKLLFILTATDFLFTESQIYRR